MNESKIVVGIDIGTSKIATVIARIDEFLNILGISETPSHGIRKGQIVDLVDAVSSINASLEAAERMAGYSASHVIVSIGGGHIESLNSKGVVAVSAPQGEITPSDVTRVIDAAKAVSLPSSREIIHVLPRSYTVDGQEGIKDPIGMTGIRLEVDTHIVSSASPAIRNIEKALSEVGVDIDAVVYNGYASSLATLSDTEKELGVILVDIGSGTTDISVFTEGSLAYSSVLAIGARHITNDLAIGLRISLESAEKIKLFLSNPPKDHKVTHENEEEKTKSSDEIDLSSLHLAEDISKVSKKTLVDGIIRPRLNEIFTFIGLEVKKSGFAGQTPSGLVITGGGAGTVGAVESAKRTLAMPVRIGAPSGLKGIIDEIQSPQFSTVVGLAKYGGGVDSVQGLPFGISIPKIPGFSGNKMLSKLIDLVKSFIP
jgi:cell division protein FtsA